MLHTISHFTQTKRAMPNLDIAHFHLFSLSLSYSDTTSKGISTVTSLCNFTVAV